MGWFNHELELPGTQLICFWNLQHPTRPYSQSQAKVFISNGLRQRLHGILAWMISLIGSATGAIGFKHASISWMIGKLKIIADIHLKLNMY